MEAEEPPGRSGPRHEAGPDKAAPPLRRSIRTCFRNAGSKFDF